MNYNRIKRIEQLKALDRFNSRPAMSAWLIGPNKRQQANQLSWILKEAQYEDSFRPNRFTRFLIRTFFGNVPQSPGYAHDAWMMGVAGRLSSFVTGAFLAMWLA
ncbi:hypothetical protein GGR92_004823 [Spirosoma lacussanchae]|uniref:hypothetical protein n=1 Tax=Spirosoma lacussanchae TaxID=1884249 RepID=UPI0011086A8F|nr:hypothetical protein [Spirosoma lacussanchae]